MSQQALNPRQPLTAEEQKAYAQIFKSLDIESLGIVTGEAARSTFEKSGLPPSVLGEIWQLVDPSNLGFLNQFAFSVALRLIGHVQTGAKPDKSLIDSAGPIARFQGAQSLSSPTVSHTPTGSVASQQPLAAQFTSLPPLTNSDISKFSQLFSKNAPTGTISGEQARNIFLKAKLPTPVLGQIWSLVDRDNSGELSRDEFIVAMFLIQGSLNGSIVQLPPQIPQQIWSQLSGSTQSPSLSTAQTFSPQNTGQRPNISRVPSSFANAANDWYISPQKRAQFDSIFEGLDKTSQGVLGAGEVAPFLMTSKLPQDILAAIWDLADIHNTGEFSKDEFAIAMFLVQKKIAGAELPHVIPDSLYPHQHGQGADPRATSQQSVPPPPQQNIPQIPSRDTKPKSSLNDLVDLNDAFSTPTPPATDQRNVSNATVNYTPTGAKTFVPTSSFGQEIVEKQAPLSKQSVPGPITELKQDQTFKAPSSADTRTFSPPTASAVNKSVTGGAIGGVIGGAIGGAVVSGLSHLGSSSTGSAQPKNPFPQVNQRNASTTNSDLLADANPEVSGQLSRATTDLANLSNQIGSLTSQTSQLHEKRTRAEKELAKVTTLKNDIESKLTKLRVAYEQEVKQTQEVEGLLASSKTETEQLRQEASVAEAQYNQVQNQLQAIQTELEEAQKENAALKERLGILNAEQIEATKQLEKTQTDVKQSKGLVAINSKQLTVAQVNSQGIKDEIAALLASVEELDTHHENYIQKQVKLKGLQDEVESSEKTLSERQQQLQDAEAAFQAKEEEFQQRLEQQKQNGLAIEQEEQRVQASFESLQERRRQLEDAERQLDEQTVAYAQRVQDFTYKQIDDATNGAVPREGPVAEEVEPAVKSVKDPEDPEEKQQEGSDKGLIGAVAGAVAGAIGATAISATQGTSSEPNNTEFTAGNEASETGTSVTSEDYQYRSAAQFGHLDIERPRSATSSVQNNAPQSVRGDDIDDIPSTDTVAEQPALASDVLQKDYNPSALRSVVPEGEGSGAGSFEIVDENDKSQSDYTLRPTTESEFSNDETPSLGITADEIEASIPGAFSPPEETQKEVESQTEDAFPEVKADILEDKETEESDVGTYDSLKQTSTSGSIPPSVPAPRKVTEDEFPPIQELAIQESDSDSGTEDEFHETSDSYPSQQKNYSKEPLGNVSDTAANVGDGAALGGISAFASDTTKSTNDAFGDEFADLKETLPSTKNEDDEFAGLEAAEESFNDFDEEFTDQPDFNQEFEGTTFFGADAQQSTPQQQSQPQAPETQDNEEWEQIFAGFGNQNAQHPVVQGGVVPAAASQDSSTPVQSQLNSTLQHPQPSTLGHSSSTPQRSRIATTPRSLAVQELEGMGFSREESLEALEREKWNLEAATNFLLDNA